MVKFLSLSSGSNGNCYFFSNGRTSFLIDLGIGNRTIKKRLAEHGFDIEQIDFVLVTHDHFDHIKSLGTFTDRYKRPVYATRTLHTALRHNFCTAGLLTGCERYIKEGVATEICGVEVTPFIVPHDATQTLGYHLNFDGERFTVMTDLGEVTDDAVRFAEAADNLVVESNYDVDMLVTGNYPPQLKERILREHGHLSNEQTSSLLRRASHEGLRNVWLCHLSANNNTPQTALKAAKKTLESIGSQASVHCLPRSESSELFTF